MVLTQQEEKNKRIAMAISVAMHVLLLLLLFFVMAWDKEDIKPDNIGGIELSFGTTDVGSGDVNSKAAPNESTNTEDSQPAAEAPKAVPTPQPNQPTPTAEPQNDRVVTTTADAPVSIKETKAEPKPEPVKEEPKKVDNRAIFPGKAKTGSGNGTSGSSNNPTGNNNGDEGVTGDKGRPEGKYPGKKTGNGGSGGGNLNMPGWRYDIAPKADPYDNESGIVKIEIKIDAEGSIVSLRVVESNVSPRVQQWYKDQVQRTTFSRIAGGNSSAGATGTITFIIRSN
ncbi:hypothetical protein [Rufibacter sp. LB8]|uniref:hypothetical protein n=1 Tax=Rufibacter sp. LB8 TaxID=2777781 RepID=UPI00178C6795|nr:hypothetical protein [Rufibacter sp. LB8]